jgi:hypothetical protein
MLLTAPAANSAASSSRSAGARSVAGAATTGAWLQDIAAAISGSSGPVWTSRSASAAASATASANRTGWASCPASKPAMSSRGVIARPVTAEMIRRRGTANLIPASTARIGAAQAASAGECSPVEAVSIPVRTPIAAARPGSSLMSCTGPASSC